MTCGKQSQLLNLVNIFSVHHLVYVAKTKDKNGKEKIKQSFELNYCNCQKTRRLQNIQQ